jgi:hypothetical protein
MDLAEWRAARHAAESRQSTDGRFPLLLGNRVFVSRDVGFELELTLVSENPTVRVCLLSAVNDVPVRIVVRDRFRSSPAVSAPPVPSEP